VGDKTLNWDEFRALGNPEKAPEEPKGQDKGVLYF